MDGEATSNDYDNSEQHLRFTSTANDWTANVIIRDDECYEEAEKFQAIIDDVEPRMCSGVDGEISLEITITDDDCEFAFFRVQKTGKSRSLKKFGYTQDNALLFRPNCCPLLVHL